MNLLSSLISRSRLIPQRRIHQRVEVVAAVQATIPLLEGVVVVVIMVVVPVVVEVGAEDLPHY